LKTPIADIGIIAWTKEGRNPIICLPDAYRAPSAAAADAGVDNKKSPVQEDSRNVQWADNGGLFASRLGDLRARAVGFFVGITLGGFRK
jgi:hypothetical protein